MALSYSQSPSPWHSALSSYSPAGVEEVQNHRKTFDAREQVKVYLTQLGFEEMAFVGVFQVENRDGWFEARIETQGHRFEVEIWRMG